MVPDLRIEEHGRIRELVYGRLVLVTVAIVLALTPLPVRSQEVESVEGGHRRGRSLPVCGRVAIGHGLLTATALDACALVLGETGLDPRIGTGLAEIALDVTGRGLLTATDHVVSVRVPQLAGRSRSRDRRPSSPDCSRSGEKGRLARRDQQKGGETAEVSQAPAVSEASTGVTPAAGGTPLSALPSAVQDLARFFLNLSGSSSLGAVGGVAGVAASTAGSGVQLCTSTSAGGAVALGAATVIPAGAGDLTAAPAAVLGVSGQQQRQEDSCSSRRRRRSSSDGPTDDRRSVTGGGLLLLCLPLVVGRGTIGLPRYLLRKTEPMLLLPELDVRLEVHLAILALLELMTVLHVLGRHGRL